MNTTFVHDRTKHGWKLVEDVGFQPPITSPKKLELVSFLKEDASYNTSEVMAERATELKAALGQQHAEWLLTYQAEIPKEFQNYLLVFPGTIWCDSDGFRSVPYLRWYDDEWCLYFFWLGYRWYDYYRLLRLRE